MLHVLRVGECERFKMYWHLVIGIGAVGAALYSAAAWLARRDAHLAANCVVYTALSCFERAKIRQHAQHLPILLALLTALSCNVRSTPVVPPEPATKAVALHVTDATGVGLVGARAQLDLDAFGIGNRLGAQAPIVVTTDANGRAVFAAVPWDTRQVQLTITADGFEPWSESVRLPDQLSYDWPEPVVLQRQRSALTPLRAAGRQLQDGTGRVFQWRSVTAFRLVDFVASGQPDAAAAYLAWARAHGITIVRVLTTARWLFVLTPERGAAALPTLLQLAAAEGLYVNVVAAADTCLTPTAGPCPQAEPYFDLPAHVTAIGAACAVAGNCVVEMANEPDHATQATRLRDPARLQALRALIPATVPVALGPAHGADDESRAYVGGDFIVVHGDRADGDGGWRWVRHTNEQRVLSEETRQFVVNNEPKRDDLSADKHLAMALLCRLHGLGDTFHYAGGLQAQIPTGAELTAFEARRRGWTAIPDEFVGRYTNAGFPDSPVKSFRDAVRAYSSVRVRDGYTLVFGFQPAPQIEWSDNWPTRVRRFVDGGTQLWQVVR